MRPFKPGALDRFCSVYPGINSLVMLGYDLPQKKAQALYDYVIDQLECYSSFFDTAENEADYKRLEQIQEILFEISLPEKLSSMIRDDVKRLINLENEVHTKRIDELRRQYDNKQKQLLRLKTLLLNDDISVEDYKTMNDLLKSEQEAINEELALHTKADQHFKLAISTLLSLGKNLPILFKSSKVDTKREILNFLLSNLKINDGNLSYTWNFPFSKLRDFRHFSNWRE